jgi:hypothetical protein
VLLLLLLLLLLTHPHLSHRHHFSRMALVNGSETMAAA